MSIAPNNPHHYHPLPRTLPFTTLDVFTSTPYAGNPLALIRIPASLRHLITQAQKERIAAEFNLSETIFLHEQTDPFNPEWDVDIFTSDAELPFAGHPTIGAASFVLNVLGAGGGKGRAKGQLITKAGPIPVSLVSDAESKDSNGTGMARVQADIPHDVHIHAHTIGDLERPIPGLSLLPAIRQAELSAPIVSIVKGMTFLLVRLPDLETLAGVQLVGEDVNFHGVLDPEWGSGFVAKYYFVILGGNGEKLMEERTGMLSPALSPVVAGELEPEYSVAAADMSADRISHPSLDPGASGVTRIRSRMLEVAMEDPATGSAASALGCYLALEDGRIGERTFEITQGVEMGRRSVIGVEVVIGDGASNGGFDGGRGRDGRRVQGVRLSGGAVVVMEGNLRV